MKQNSNLETKVGIFLMLGIGLICTLIIIFGEVPDLFKPTYSLTVKFPDASGLLKGSDVYLAGAVIGKVTTRSPLHSRLAVGGGEAGRSTRAWASGDRFQL